MEVGRSRVDEKRDTLEETHAYTAKRYHRIPPKFVAPLLRILLDIMLRCALGFARHCRNTLERSFGIALHRVPVKPI